MTTSSKVALQPFHLAFPVGDLELARDFYGRVLGCPLGRSDDSWVDFNLYGHQVVAHLADPAQRQPLQANQVDGKSVPVPQFGVVLEWPLWEELATRLRGHGIEFVIDPYVRFEGQVGEQATMFFLDPFGNALEFKAFRDPEQLFRA